jgi:hypothetical protein
MNKIRILFILFFVIIISLSCGKDSEKAEHEISSEPLAQDASLRTASESAFFQDTIKGKNIRKNGNMSIEVNDCGKAKDSVREFVEENEAQILVENISVESDDRIEIYYKIKVKSEHFYPLLDKISALGKLTDMKVKAEDISDEVTKQSDKIELLTSRLNEAKKKNNTKEIAALEAKLNEAKKEKLKTTDSILYSYINLYINEGSKISHAFYLGYYYGKEGLIWTIKVSLIVLLTVIPVIVLIFAIRLFIALIKLRWKRLVQYLEGAGKGESKDPEKTA